MGFTSLSRRRRDRPRQPLPITGVRNLSFRDYPGKLCVTALVAGCNFRCSYCTTPDIVLTPNQVETVPRREVLDALYRKRGFLNGFCISGGEPTLHNALLPFLFRVKSMGYSVKLDTNGSRPKRIRKLMEEKVVDYVALDVKAPLSRYPEVVRKKVDVGAVNESIKLLRRGGVDYEFRTTLVPGLLDGGDLEEIAKYLVGSRRFVIRRFMGGRTMCPEYSGVKPYSVQEMWAFRDRVAPYFGDCVLQL
jgi:pyruvate formate lyase activating enzyme